MATQTELKRVETILTDVKAEHPVSDAASAGTSAAIALKRIAREGVSILDTAVLKAVSAAFKE